MCDVHGKCGSCSGVKTLPGAGKVLQYNIKRYGFGIVYAYEDVPNFAYTAGIEETWNHPELIVFGLDYEMSTRLLNETAKLIKEGAVFGDRSGRHRILDHFEVTFIEVPRDVADHYLSETADHYDQGQFTALQILWSDSEGRFPLDADCSAEVKRFQPVLSQRG